jgi:hypothetical protein
MRKLLLMFLAAGFIFSCSKDDDSGDGEPLESRMIGVRWNLTGVKYFSIVPNPDNPNQQLPINGNGEMVNGSFFFRPSADSVEYDIRFTGIVTLPEGNPIIIPVERTSVGGYEFSEDNKKVFIYREDTLVFNVRRNTASEQVWNASIPHHITSINQEIVIDVEVTMRR